MTNEQRFGTENRGAFASWVWVAAAVVGVLLSLAAGMVSYGYTEGSGREALCGRC